MAIGFRGTVQQARAEAQVRHDYYSGMANASPDAERFRRQIAAGRKIFGANVRTIIDVEQMTPNGPYEAYR